MKKTVKRFSKRLVAAVLTVVMFAQATNLALAFYVAPEWNFLRLTVAGTNETLADGDGVRRAYNPNIERGEVSFTLEKVQPAAIEVWAADPATPDGAPIGYLRGKLGETTVTFDVDANHYFKGYDGLFGGLEEDPFADAIDETSFINTIAWDGEVADSEGGSVLLEDGVEYVLVVRPLTEGEEENYLELAVRIDRNLPWHSLGSPFANAAPFGLLSGLPGTHGISVLTGNYAYSSIDLAIAGADILSFSRTYNSTDEHVGILGYGWRTGFDYSLEKTDLYVRVNMPDGTKLDFAMQVDGTYAAPAGSNHKLEKVFGGYELTSSTQTVYEFNSEGKITKLTTIGGFETAFGYSGGKLSTVTGRSGTLTFGYSGGVYVTSIDASSGRSVAYGYEGGNLVSFTNPDGKVFEYGYDGNHNMTSFTDGNGSTSLTLNYDGYSRVTEAYINGDSAANTLEYNLALRATVATDSTGRETTYRFDRDGHVVARTSEAGTKRYVYEDGRCVEEINENNEKTAYAFDANGNLAQVTNADGSGSRITYNAQNLPTKTEVLAAGGSVMSVASYDYDLRGNITSATDENGKTTTYVYDIDNNCTESHDPDGNVTYFSYTDGRLTGVETPDGGGAEMTYNADGKLISEKTKLGFETKYTYDANGYLVQIVDALGNLTKLEVDGNGRTTARIDVGTGARTEWEYDSTGNVESMTDPIGRVTEYSYDSAGRQLTQVSPYDGTETSGISYTYNADGRVVSMTDARGNAWSYGYDSRGYQTSLTDPYGNGFVGVYDSNGRMTSSTDARGGVTSFTYDAKGRVTVATDAMGGEREYGYDGNGNMTSAEDENGNTWRYTYDSKNNVKTATDPNGKVISYEYDTAGRLTKLTSPEGSEQTFVYDEDGRLEESTDGESNTTRYFYDGLARLTAVEYTDGTGVSYGYDSLGRMTEFTDANGNISEYRYDPAGQLESYKNALGAETKYAYYASGLLESTENALGGVTSYTYDKNGNLLTTTDALGQTATLTYDNLNRVTEIEDARGNATILEYDASGNVTRITSPDGGTVEYTYDLNNRMTETKQGELGNESVTKLEYDPVGNVKKIIDALGNELLLDYDALNRNTGVALPDGGEVSYTYDEAGRVRTVTQKISDSVTATTTYTYDKNGRVVKLEDALGNFRAFKYDAVGQIIEETDANGKTSKYEYDAAGQLIKYTDPMGNVVDIGYDELGRITSETAPHAESASANTTSYKYDVLNRVELITDPMGRKTAITYDAIGRIETVTDAKNGKTTYGYDANGNITSVKDARGNTSTFGYDSMNRLVEANTPNGEVTLYSYDTRGLVTKLVDPSRGTTVAEYDKNGNLVSETGANGNVTEYEYDALSRVKKVAYGDGRAASYAYNAAGQLVEMTDWTGVTQFESDILGRIKEITAPNGGITSYEWDNVGNRTKITTPDGAEVAYKYNANNQMTEAITSDGATRYEYFDSTLLMNIELPNGEAIGYTYNRNGSRVSEEHSLNGSPRRTYGYSYDELGRLTSETRSNIGIGLDLMPIESYSYSYDAMDRLTQFRGSNGEATDYSYDVAGNLTKEVSTLHGTTDYAYSGNRLASKTTPDGTYAYTYDNAGNMLTETFKGVLNKTLTYDATGRFVQGANAAGDTTEYVYNGFGYRVENTTTRQNPNFGYQNSAASAGSAYFADIEGVIDAWRGSEEWTYIDETGKVRQSETSVTTKSYTVDFTTGGLRDIMVAEAGMFSQTYSYGLGLISVQTTADATAEPSVQQTLATEYNEHYYAHQNRLGGASYYTDDAGKLLQYNEFDAWGNAYTGTPDDLNHNGLNNGLGFTGYTWDSVLGVWFAQARMYDAGTKRFLSADPIGGSVLKPVLFNPYLYCASDPVNNIDPTGMYMPGDENLGLTPEQVSAIDAYSDAWFAAQAAGDQAGMDAAHASANAIRNGGGTGSPTTPGMGAYPPGMWDILAGVIQHRNPGMTYEEAMQTAEAWLARIDILRPGVTGPAIKPVEPLLEKLAHVEGSGGLGGPSYYQEYKKLVDKAVINGETNPVIFYGVDPMIQYAYREAKHEKLTLEQYINLMGSTWENKWALQTFKDRVYELALCIGGLALFIGITVVPAMLAGVEVAKHAVVIGETVARVERAARALGANTFKAYTFYTTVEKLLGTKIADFLTFVQDAIWMLYNIAIGTVIIDIGMDPTRPYTSAYYAMERIAIDIFARGDQVIRILEEVVKEIT